MSWLGELFGVQKHAATPERTIIGLAFGGGVTPYGVTPTTAFALSSVWGAMRIIRNGISQLEWRESRGTLDLPLSRIITRPQAERTRREWTMLVVETLALFDTCHLLKVGGVDSEGVPMSLIPIPPHMIAPLTVDPWSFAPPTEYWIGKDRVSIDDMVILHVGVHPGIPDTMSGILKMARTSFSAAMAAENYASRYWQTGGSPTTQIKTDQAITAGQATEIGNRWAEMRQLGPDHPAVLGMGAEAKPFGADPTTQSAVDVRREMIADIARYFGIPTRLLNAPTGDKETYTASGDTNLDLLRFTLQNYIDAICDGLSDQLPGQRVVTMETTRLTRGSHLARAQAWQLALAGTRPWMSVEEVREAEGLPPQETPEGDPLPQVNAPNPQAAGPAQLNAPRSG